ncbi:MAG TPA: nucleotidyltransferase family protein [Gemmatimonadaceae bacterium]|nr:nucleotidyltransferase family protein [Gemmatimonadaceae bacterium]
MSSLSTAEKTTDLVRLRRWAMAQICRERAPDRDSQQWLSSVPEESWRMFLILERCASPLLAALLDAQTAKNLPAPALSLLKHEAARETEGVLRAERDARWIAAFSRETKVRPIALKGLLPAMAEATPPLHLFDVDILASAADEKIISQHLKNAGFSAAADNEIHHVYWAPPPGHLPIELHQTIFSTGAPLADDAWMRVTEVAAVPGMYRLAYADQMLHMLHHALVQHTDRHVRIRDLLLMAWVMKEMNEDEHRQLDKLVDALPSGEAFRGLLQFAKGFADKSANDEIVDPYEDDAILFFAATILSQDSHIWSGGPPLAWQGAASVAAGRNSLADLTKFASRNPVTGIKAFSSLQRKAPLAGQAITRVGRAALYFTSATVGSPVLLAIRREVTRRLNAPFSSR